MNLLLAAAVAGAALAQSYPADLDQGTLQSWLLQAADVAPEQVVAVSPSAATALLSRTPRPNGRTEARLLAVALTPEAARRSGVAAWEMRLQVDCRTGQVLTGATTGYPAAKSRAGAVTLAPGDAAWRRPAADTALGSAWRAICDPNFHPPLAPDATPSRIAMARTAAPEPTRPAPPPPPPQQQPRRAPRAAPPPLPALRGNNAAQVVSSPVEAETRRRLARLKGRFGAAMQGLETRVETAQVQGRTVFRGVVTGFGSRPQAVAFCATLKRAGQDCLPR